ncbi:hypothetical protein B0H17DRAFT_1111131 [Mycena rosella]|uniref:Uncharacterized protein n=1 Tax=Mycena rosella TaxID=1033263 RepID=A0AAD7FKI4_MYCRO|nr:hypothetical protein B0H17DRAFT_1111131 [Mycena rosella]
MAAIDLLRNKDTSSTARLTPFDGRVGAIVQIHEQDYFITTNADYIPALPPTSKVHRVYLRTDMRYGVDDPCLWPQQFSPRFQHLPAISKREARPEIDDFEVGSTMTTRLGKLAHHQFTRFVKPVSNIVAAYEKYCASVPEGKILPIFPQLVQSMLLALERLQTLPSTFEKMVFGVTSVQRTYLELDALLSYTQIYKPRMESLTSIVSAAPPHSASSLQSCMGAFTANPEVAQLLFMAQLPFWLLRPTAAFFGENILAIAPLVDPPPALQGKPAPGYPMVYSGISTDAKIEAMSRATQQVPWYKDPFSNEGSEKVTEGSPSQAGPVPHHSGASNRAQSKRSGEPYRGSRHQAKVPAPGSGGRDKFIPLQAAEMPEPVPAWDRALRAVDRSAPSISLSAADKFYVFPEPALLASAERPQRRQMYLHHWMLLRDACLYRLGEPSSHGVLLSSQEWRDILGGQIQQREGRADSRTNRRSQTIAHILGPALRACGIDRMHGYPAAPESIGVTSLAKAKQMIWDIAETNFRFELAALDRRASGKDRPELCSRCYSGGMMLGMNIELSQQGLASPWLEEYHPYYVQLATLMLDWRTPGGRPALIAPGFAQRTQWSEQEMVNLEDAVARYYTQSFYELFGRAAVIPMRLER